MKKIFSFFSVFFLMAAAYAQKQNLKLNLVKGEVYTHGVSSNTSLIQTINGQKMDINVTVSGKMSFKVSEIKDSVYDMEVQYEKLALKMQLPNGTMNSDSEKDGEDMFSTMLSAIKNKPFYIKMSVHGKILQLKNIDTLFSGMFDKLPNLTDNQKQQVQQQLSQAYGEKAFKGSIEMVCDIFPVSPVSKADKWLIKTQLESGMSAEIETTYNLENIGDTTYSIHGDSKIKTADKDAYIESNGMPMKYDLTGTMKSDIKINKKTGWIIEAKIDQNINGNAQIKDNPKLPGGMAIPMTINTNMTIQGK